MACDYILELCPSAKKSCVRSDQAVFRTEAKAPSSIPSLYHLLRLALHRFYDLRRPRSFLTASTTFQAFPLPSPELRPALHLRSSAAFVAFPAVYCFWFVPMPEVALDVAW